MGNFVPNGVRLEEQEYATILVLLEAGYDVEAFPRSNTQGVHTPDIRMDGLLWEMKAPKGKGNSLLLTSINRKRTIIARGQDLQWRYAGHRPRSMSEVASCVRITSGVKSSKMFMCGKNMSDKRPSISILFVLVLAVCLSGCGGRNAGNSAATSGTMGESAADLSVDLSPLIAQNPDIFGWLYIPESGIDDPLMQRIDGDDAWYLTHDCTGAESPEGALFIEAGNLLDMCDFNTIIHGYGGKGGIFEELTRFADPDYFDSHGQCYIVIDGNALTYEIWTAYERNDTSILRSYDLTETSGCEAYLEDMRWEQASSGALIREGWEAGVGPDTFLITLTADSVAPGRQFVVQGCLIADQAGTIRR